MAIGVQLSGPFSSPAKRVFVLCLLLITLTLVVYLPVTHNDFINFDDDAYITANSHVRAGLTWPTWKWSITTLEQGNWHPLTWLSHAFDCQLFGLNPAGHHFVSAWLHAMNVALLFFLLQSATGFTWRSLMVAALFGFHPINVESVAWAAERKNVLSMLFFLLALLAYGWYARHPALGRYGAVFLLFLLALLSKPQVVAFPFLLLLWDYWPLQRMNPPPTRDPAAKRPGEPRTSFSFLVLEKLPLFFLCLASAVVTVIAQRSSHALRTSADYSLLNRIENALTSYVRYVGMAVWPSRLALYYPHRTGLFPLWQVVAATLALALVTALATWQSRQRPYLLVGWLWFLGSMLPMIGLVQVGEQAMADRYAYIPLIGLFIAAVWTVADWAMRRQIPTAWLTAPAIVVLVLLAIATHREIGFWHDTSSIWRRALQVTENNFVAHTNLATFLDQQGLVDEAAVHQRAALALRPDDLPATLGLATYEHQHGDLPAAIEHYQMVALRAVDPDFRAAAYSNLGSAYRQLGDYVHAKQCYQAALRLSPGRPIALVGLGLVAQHDGDYAEAVREFSNAMAVEPTDIGYLLLAQAFEQEGRPAEAAAARQRASLISPDLNKAQTQANALLAGK